MGYLPIIFTLFLFSLLDSMIVLLAQILNASQHIFLNQNNPLKQTKTRQEKESSELQAPLSYSMKVPGSAAIETSDPCPLSRQYTPCNVPGPGCEEREFCEAFPGCDCEPECGPLCVCIARSGRALCPAVECSPLCRCDETCPNRKVQHGICFRLQVFKTTAKGFGVRTLEPIARGSYVCPYAGEAIGLRTARERVRGLDPHEPNYVMALREGGRVSLVVDPSRVGGVGRFLNHSCDPNLEMVPVRAQCVVPELCLFARRDVGPGEELTYDYSGGSNGRGGRPCLCGTPACRGQLPLDVDVLGV